MSSTARPWTANEDAYLRQAARLYRNNLELLGMALERTPDDCASRLAGPPLPADANPTAAAERHFILQQAMRSASAKPPTPSGSNPPPPSSSLRPALSLSAAAKRLAAASASVHPSHDAAVRRANQSINRLLTPGELALRRLQQRNRIVMGDLNGGGAAASAKASPLLTGGRPSPKPPALQQSGSQ